MRNNSIRRVSILLLLVGLLSCGGSDSPGTTEPDPPVATEIVLSQTALQMTFLGQVAGLTATVRDQFAAPFNAVVTWSSDDTSVATVTAGGQVAAVANGVTTIRATSGSLSASVSVTVQQVASRVFAVSGDGQTGTVGEALSDPIVVRSEDQGGSPVPGATITFAVQDGHGSVSVAEATTDAESLASTNWTLGTVSGPQQVTASISGSGGTAIGATALAGPPAGIEKTSGDNQTGPVGFALFQPVVVTVTDAFGNGVAGGSVSFAVTGGGGSVTPSQASAGADGAAQATWTVGAGLGANTLSASAPGIAAVQFTATGAAAKADLEPSPIETDPANPTALQSFEVSTTVTNVGYLAAGAGVQVRLQLDGVDAGTVALPSLAIGASSEATFTIGPLTAGSHSLSVSVDPGSTLDEWDESNNSAQRFTDIPVTTLITAGTPVSGLSAADSVELLFTLELPASQPGTMEITLEGGSGDPDLYVHRGDRPAHRDDYACQSGNPTTIERCVINAAEPGTYHILIFAWDEFTGVTLLATTGGEVIPFNIEIEFINHGTPAQDAVIEAAAAQWMKIIPGDISDFDYSFSPLAANTCIEGQPLIDGTIDDLRIYVDIIEIDGPSGTLGQAGPCDVRGLGFLPMVGIMQFDEEDLDVLANNGELMPVVMHEMAHVLGLGTAIWDLKELLQNPSLPSSAGVDTHFTGDRAIDAFDAAGRSTTYTLGEKVPVENTADEGSADAHWRESVLARELMTPTFSSGSLNPLSAISIESLADMGYTVDVTQAEAFVAVYRAPSRLQETEHLIDLSGDVWRGPLFISDAKGRFREVIRR